MIFISKPEKFEPDFEATGCFCENNGKILLLQRASRDKFGGFWGLPSGKIEKNETPYQAMLRELKEETGVQKPDIEFFKKIYVQYNGTQFTYYIFSTKFEKEKIKLIEQEHQDYCWISPKNALNLKLIHHLDDCIRLFYQI